MSITASPYATGNGNYSYGHEYGALKVFARRRVVLLGIEALTGIQWVNAEGLE
jgi:hypothetical protein